MKPPLNPMWGSENPQWKGDKATIAAKRLRAGKLYPEVGRCEGCGADAIDRHHKNGDTGDNSPENIAFLCRRCHMAEDGRLEAFLKWSRDRKGKSFKDPSPCVICSQLYKPLRKGRCGRCSQYYAAHGVERPPDLRR